MTHGGIQMFHVGLYITVEGARHSMILLKNI
jgi:hypothetical protein